MNAKVLALALFGAILLTGCQTNQNQPVRGREYWAWDSTSNPPSAARKTLWQSMGRSEMAQMFIEKALYQLPKDDGVYMQIGIKNLTTREISVDLRDFNSVIHPGLWGVYTAGKSPVVAGPTMSFNPLDQRSTNKLLADYRNKELVAIPPGMSVNYFVEFPTGTLGQMKSMNGQAFATVFEGQIAITDGKIAERLYAPRDNYFRSLTMGFPPPWGTIAPGQWVIKTAGPATAAPLFLKY